MALWRGFWLFPHPPVDGWWLSVSGLLLDASWSLHNVIAWIKIAPFLSRRYSQLFIWSIFLVQAYWIMEVYANFAYFHGYNRLFLKTRPWEALCRDPWWILTGLVLFWKIKAQYGMTLRETVSISPRFGLMLLAGILSIIFFVLDICSVTKALRLNLPNGVNPFWKLSSVFKCLADCVILDDFKTALDRLRAYKLSRMGSFSQDTSTQRAQHASDLTRTWDEIESNLRRHSGAMSPGGSLVQMSHVDDTDPRLNDIEHAYPRQEHETMAASPTFLSQDHAQAAVREIEDTEVAAPRRSGSGPYRTLATAHVRY